MFAYITCTYSHLCCMKEKCLNFQFFGLTKAFRRSSKGDYQVAWLFRKRGEIRIGRNSSSSTETDWHHSVSYWSSKECRFPSRYIGWMHRRRRSWFHWNCWSANYYSKLNIVFIQNIFKYTKKPLITVRKVNNNRSIDSLCIFIMPYG